MSNCAKQSQTTESSLPLFLLQRHSSKSTGTKSKRERLHANLKATSDRKTDATPKRIQPPCSTDSWLAKSNSALCFCLKKCHSKIEYGGELGEKGRVVSTTEVTAPRSILNKYPIGAHEEAVKHCLWSWAWISYGTIIVSYIGLHN